MVGEKGVVVALLVARALALSLVCSRSLARVSAPGRQWVPSRFSRARVVVVLLLLLLLLRLMSMGHCSEQWPGFEVTKDWNGADQVAIRSPRGASVRVSPLLPQISVCRFRRAIGSAFLGPARSVVCLMRPFGCGSRSACTAGRSSRGGTTAARSSSSPAAR